MPDMSSMNWTNWGKLVETWARDRNSRPPTVVDLNAQMASANVGVSFSETEFTGIAFAQAPDAKTVQIFLPTVAAIDRAKKHLEGGGEYVLPDFYKTLAFDDRDPNIKDGDKLKFLSSRIGDYAIGQCG